MFVFAFSCALVCFLAGLVFQFFTGANFKAILKWGIFSLIGNLALNFLLVYIFVPGQTGPLLGMQFVFFPLLINLIVSGAIWMFLNSDYNNEEAANTRKGECLGSLGAIVILGLVLMIVQVSTNWGEGNAKYKANYLPITQANEDTFPSTDPDFLVLTPPTQAKATGGRALTNGGQNLGSIYKPGEYTLQAVNGHMYYIAPLIYQNVFSNFSNPMSPGIVVVDAEDPYAEPFLKTEHALRYMPDAIFNQDLVRHTYLNGYANYRLLDPTMEVDDNWVPYFTLDASQYVTGLTGVDVKGVLVINAETGVIAKYSWDDKPTWIDRVLPVAAADEYVGWYGEWSKSPWFFLSNLQGKDKEMAANDITPLAYSSIENSPVYQYVMSSKNTTDFASTGVLLVDTNKLQATRYPIFGIAVGSQVDNAFTETIDNKVNKYPHTPPVLVRIYDRLTWFTVYVSSENADAMFVGIGFMDARTTGANNVIMAPSKEEALARYHQWLANRPSNTTDVSGSAEDLSFVGTISLIQSEVQNGVTYYFFYAADNTGKIAPIVFYGIADMQTAELRFAKEGDSVNFTYKLAENGTATVISFDDLVVPPVGN